MDNASVCDVLARTAGKFLLAKYNIHFHTDNARIWCLAHVVNLIVQWILADLDEADHPDINNYYLGNKHLPIHYDPNEDEEIQAWEMDDVSDDEETDDTEKALRKATGAALEDDKLGIELEVTGDLSEVKKVRVPHCSGRDTVY